MTSPSNERRHELPPDLYWELRYRVRDLEAVESERRLARARMEMVSKQVEDVNQLVEFGKHEYSFDDAHCAIVRKS